MNRKQLQTNIAQHQTEPKINSFHLNQNISPVLVNTNINPITKCYEGKIHFVKMVFSSH